MKKIEAIILIIGILVCTFVIIPCVHLSKDLSKENATLTKMKEENEKITLNIQSLKNLINNGNDDEYIQKAARERLGMAFEGEEVYEDVD